MLFEQAAGRLAVKNLFQFGLLVALYLIASGAIAQNAQPTTTAAPTAVEKAELSRTDYEDWVLECLDTSVDGMSCQATYTVLFGPERAPVFIVAVAAGVGQSARIMFALPLDIQLKQGLVITNGTRTFRYAFDRCTTSGCLVEAPLTADIYEMMTASPTGSATVVRDGGQPFEIPFSFKGFVSALAAVGARNAAVQGQ